MTKSQYVLLGLLNRFGGMSGYDVKKHINKTIKPFWDESFSQIYPSFERLNTQGYVKKLQISENSTNGRIVYEITEKGTKAFTDWVHSPITMQKTRSELLIRMYLGHESIPDRMVSMILEVQAEMTEQYNLFIGLRNINSETLDQNPYENLILDFGIKHRKFVMDWCDHALKNLQESD